VPAIQEGLPHFAGTQRNFAVILTGDQSASVPREIIAWPLVPVAGR
jgi:hypothetical protein